jgi:hypothetical protein
MHPTPSPEAWPGVTIRHTAANATLIQVTNSSFLLLGLRRAPIGAMLNTYLAVALLMAFGPIASGQRLYWGVIGGTNLTPDFPHYVRTQSEAARQNQPP